MFVTQDAKHSKTKECNHCLGSWSTAGRFCVIPAHQHRSKNTAGPTILIRSLRLPFAIMPTGKARKVEPTKSRSEAAFSETKQLASSLRNHTDSRAVEPTETSSEADFSEAERPRWEAVIGKRSAMRKVCIHPAITRCQPQ